MWHMAGITYRLMTYVKANPRLIERIWLYLLPEVPRTAGGVSRKGGRGRRDPPLQSGGFAMRGQNPAWVPTPLLARLPSQRPQPRLYLPTTVSREAWLTVALSLFKWRTVWESPSPSEGASLETAKWERGPSRHGPGRHESEQRIVASWEPPNDSRRFSQATDCVRSAVLHVFICYLIASDDTPI